MRPLFSRQADTLLRLALAALVAAPVAAVAGAMAFMRSPYATGQRAPVEQPIPFDHRHHVRDAAIPCAYCHATASSARFAGVPSTSLCMGCHAQVWNDSPLLAPLRRAHETGAPIRWRRVHRMPDHVFFDHSAHVTRGVDCAVCHGRVDLMASVYQAAPMTMGWCLDCHRDPVPRLALDVHPPTHCSACHR